MLDYLCGGFWPISVSFVECDCLMSSFRGEERKSMVVIGDMLLKLTHRLTQTGRLVLVIVITSKPLGSDVTYPAGRYDMICLYEVEAIKHATSPQQAPEHG